MKGVYGYPLAGNASKVAAVILGLLVAINGFAQRKPKTIRPSNLTDEAMKTAKNLQDLQTRAWALVNIAKALMPVEERKGMDALKEAISVAEKIGDPYGKGMSLYEVAVLAAKTDKALAKKVIQDALKAAEGIDSPATKGFVMRILIQPLSKIDLREARSVARHISDPLQKGLALGHIALELAKRNPREAIALAESIADPYNKVTTLASIGREAKDERQGSDAFKKALTVAKGMTAAQRDIALRAIAEQMAGKDPKRALQVAQGIGTPLHKAWALSAVAKAMAERKDGASALQVLDEALTAAAKERNPNSQVIALRPISVEMSKLNKQRASRLFDWQIQLAKTLDERQQAVVLGIVVSDLAPFDPKKAQALAAGIPRSLERAMALGVVAEAWASSDFERAVQIARGIKDASLRAVTLARIAAKTVAKR